MTLEPGIRKRTLSASSNTSNKRINSDEHQPHSQANSPSPDSGDETGSIGASRLRIQTPEDHSPASGEFPLPTSALANPPTMPQTQAHHNSNDPPPSYTPPTPPAPEVTPASGLCPPGEVQDEIIAENQRALPEAGDSWYLVSRAWYRRWQVATSGQATKEETPLSIDEVGPIDTFSLIDSSGNLRMPLLADVDVSVLSSQSWGMLKDW